MERVIKPKRDKYLILNSEASQRTTNGNNTTEFYWRLNTPIDINENVYLQVVDRVYETYEIDTVSSSRPYIMRLISPAPQNIINTAIYNNAVITLGNIIDLGYAFRDANKAIEAELPPSTTINDITITLNTSLTANTGILTTQKFIIVLKISEREPEYLTYGSMNNVGIQAYNR